MTVVRHQTIKLSRGWHDSPDEGACVMELASMPAGEEFSDENVPWPRRALTRMLNAVFEEIPSYAFYGLTVHNDETHAEVLALVDEPLAIKPGDSDVSAASVGQRPAAGPSHRMRSRTAQSQTVGSM